MPDAFETRKLSTGNVIAYRGRLSKKSKKLIVFLHGLGDDSTAFEDWTEDDDVFPGWNLISPDLPGFGGTSRINTGKSVVTESAEVVLQLIDDLAPNEVILVVHSMSGVIGSVIAWSLLARQKAEIPSGWFHPGGPLPDPVPEPAEGSSKAPNLNALVNIEGNLTQVDTFISGRAINSEENGRFERWYSGLVEAMIRTGNKAESRYASALLACDRRAFLAASRELIDWSESGDEGDSPAAELYRSLTVPTMFIGGGESVSPETLKWLKAATLPHKILPGAGHAVMNDRPDEVAQLIQQFLI